MDFDPAVAVIEAMMDMSAKHRLAAMIFEQIQQAASGRRVEIVVVGRLIRLHEEKKLIYQIIIPLF